MEGAAVIYMGSVINGSYSAGTGSTAVRSAWRAA
jgi:hypothetical protein